MCDDDLSTIKNHRTSIKIPTHYAYTCTCTHTFIYYYYVYTYDGVLGERN